MQKILTSGKFWIAVLLFIYISLFFFQQTNLAASDLGRHIKNGEIIWSTGQVFHTNLYSYTHPDFPAPNHHWLFGVVSYLIYQASGFDGLTVLSAFLYTSAIAIVFYFSWKRSSFIPVVIATLLALPLLADRAETRPEAFSQFFFSLLFCLYAWVTEQKNTKHLWWVVAASGLIMALWINIHIFFVLTGVLGVALAFHAYLNTIKNYFTWISAIAGSLLLGALINPLGLTLILYPLNIFTNYGYRVSENQPLWFFLQYFTRPIHWYLVFFSIILVVSTAWFIKRNLKPYLYYVLVSAFFLLFTAKLIRMENVLGVTAIPLLSFALDALWQKHRESILQKIKNTSASMIASILGFGLVCAAVGTGLFFPIAPDTGVGLYPGYDQSLAFVKNLPTQGAIFNNFDSGSFLIFALHPQHKVFIDNRAEAYPSDFIQNQYLKGQEDEATWTKLEQEYNFSTIIFYRHEQTNWGQEFLVKRVQDSSWVPIYVDNFLIIFLKDTPENSDLINTYRLPAEMFSISEN